MKEITLFVLLLSAINVYSQNNLHCGTDQVTNKILHKHPELKTKFEQREQLKKSLPVKKSMSGTYTIPVVFHILHLNGGENIQDNQVIDAVNILNRDFAKNNADTTSIITSFKSIADSTGIHFELAQVAPNGNCTNGIIHYYDPDTDWDDTSPTLYSYTWDPTKYLNVYVVRDIIFSDGFSAAGYTYLPGWLGYGDPWDAIVVLHSYLGSIGTSSVYHSRVLTHEVGHWLNLLHVFGFSNAATDCNSDDYVNDTPVTQGYLDCPNINNPSSYQICNPGVNENFQNYMDYSYCNKMFTHDQGQRMRDALDDNTAGRNNLWSPSNLLVTGVNMPDVLCQADFKSSNTANTVCQGNSLTFTDLSWNGKATTWNWNFPGGTPATSTDSAPTILYNTPGVYDVGLTISNGTGSVSAAKTAYITVNPSSAVYSGPLYSEGFEGITIPNSDWKVRNPLPGGNTWKQTNIAAASGSKSVMITNTADAAATIDELISPSINVAAIAGNAPTLTFKVAYAQRTSASADKLQIYVSTNCGLTWVLRKTISGETLATAGVQNTPFTPNSSQWKQQAIPLSSFISQTKLFILFRFTSDGGNNIFIDDINISDTSATSVDEPVYTTTVDLNIYPNPAEKNTAVLFTIPDEQKVELKVYDLTGKEVLTIYNGILSAGKHQYSIPEKNALSPGTYFITLFADRKLVTRKLVITTAH